MKQAQAQKKTKHPELRTSQTEAEVRMDTDVEDAPKRIEGYAVVFGQLTDMGWYDERVLAGAFDGVLEKSDVRFVLNHDANHVLARSKGGQGTLDMEVDSHGLRFSFIPPQSRSDVAESVERGDISQCSYKYFPIEENWIHPENGEGRSIREIVKVGEVLDLCLATYPAYPTTSASLRSKEQETEDLKRSPEYLRSIGQDPVSVEAEARSRQIRIMEATL